MIPQRIKNRFLRFKPGKDENKRIVLIDFHRGLIILLMIVTHVIALTFDHSKEDKTVYYLGLIGGITSFTGFLFLSGVSSYLSFVRKEEETVKGILKIFNKEIKIFAIYYAIAVLAFFVLNKPVFNDFQDVLNAAKDILTFKVLPEFTEFLPAFALFTLSLVPLKKFYKYLSERLLQTVLVGLIIYFIGTIFINIDLGSNTLNSIKSLFFGHLDSNTRIHSFPIFQYFIIFALGISVGKFLYDNTGRIVRFNYILKILAVTIPLTVILTLIYTATRSSLFYPMPEEGRFPPSLSFLTLSITIALISLAVLDYLIQYIPNILNKFLVHLSKNTLGFLFTHLVVLFGFKYYFDNVQERVINQPADFSGVLTVYGLTLLGSMILIYVSDQINQNIIGSESFQKLKGFTLRFALPNFILLSTAGLFIFLVYTNITAFDISKGVAGELTKTIIYNMDNPNWWNDSYKIKRLITITNNSEKDYLPGQWIQFSFNHKEAYNSQNSFSKNAQDVSVVFRNPMNGMLTPVNTTVENPNSESTIVKFQLSDKVISEKVDNNYFLYYGNAEIIEGAASHSAGEVVSGTIAIGAEEKHTINATTNKFWFIKNPKTKDVETDLLFEASLEGLNLNEKVTGTYYIPKLDLVGTMPLKDGKFSINIDLSNFEPDVYTVQVEIVDLKDNLQTYQSYKVPFKVTYPLYVTWSMDWEGWDVSQYNLNEMDNIANSYGMPVTQLFNPRIYVKEQNSYDTITPERAQSLTDWVLARKDSRGDEIGMHLHMFSDMVKEAGVNPRPGSIIGAAYGDTKTSDFTQDELEKIFNWGFQKFYENNLPRPITYRTGGWFSGPHVLKAAQKAGFTIDTSGRTGGLINPAQPYSSPVPWNLPVTVWPYKPTDGDINRWEGNRLNLWEFPNNGADSYWFNANDLINRFDQNYTDPRGILNHPQVVTYLSHPHWLAGIDSPKLHVLFRYLTQYLHKNDSGPVIFSTIEGAYRQWDTIKDIDGD